MTWGMMLARLAFMSRPYNDGLGLFVTRSKMPIRNRRMQKFSSWGSRSSVRQITPTGAGDRTMEKVVAGGAFRQRRKDNGQWGELCPGGQGKATHTDKLSR